MWNVSTRAVVVMFSDYASPWIVNTPTRVLYPMNDNLDTQRCGWRSAQFVRITWNQAISTIATQIQNTVQKYGPYSLMMAAYASGNAVTNLYGAGVITYGSPSWSPHSTSGGDVYGVQPSNTYVNEVKYSKLIVLWGFIPTGGMWATNGQHLFSLAKEMGIPIIAIDPRLSSAVSVFANQWIPIRPGTDMAMMLAVAYVLFTEK